MTSLRIHRRSSSSLSAPRLRLWQRHVNLSAPLRIRSQHKTMRRVENGMRFRVHHGIIGDTVYCLTAQLNAAENGIYRIEVQNKLIPQVRLIRIATLSRLL